MTFSIFRIFNASLSGDMNDLSFHQNFLYIYYWLLRLEVQNGKYYLRVFFQPLAANQYFHEAFVFFTAIMQVNIGAERNELDQNHEV